MKVSALLGSTARSLVAVGALLGGLALAAPAQAAFELTLQQVSETDILISGTGFAPDVGAGSTLADLGLRGVLESAADADQSPGGLSGLTIGGSPITSAFIFDGDDDIVLEASPPTFSTGDVLSGSVTVAFANPVTLLPVGSTGRVTSRVSGTEIDFDTGSWTVVPLPAAAWLMIGGLGALGGAVRWSRRAQQPATA